MIFAITSPPRTHLYQFAMQVFKASQAQVAHKTYKDRGRHFSDGETSGSEL